jgi:predicted lipoprotein with Yx(FWY)xxD motif
VRLLKLVGGIALVAGLAACSDEPIPPYSAEHGMEHGKPKAATDEKKTDVDPEVAVKVTESPLGPILTDQNGRTLYGFLKDVEGADACAADCVATWPALISREPAAVGSGTDQKLLAQNDRPDGTKQVKYGKWPLYYYVGDVGAGDVDGQGVDDAWFVVAADGSLVKKS